MDILAALASDPTALPLWAVLAFAASMYPVGMLFGCQSCCQVCQSCCRDEVGQVVIDFALEGTGEQLVAVAAVGPQATMNLYPIPSSVPMPRRVAGVAVDGSGRLYAWVKPQAGG